MAVTISVVDWTDPYGAALRDDQQAELRRVYDGDAEPGAKPTAADVAVFLLARDERTGAPVACGGLRPLDDDVAEIKRMYVVPERRGQGLSRLVLAELEQRSAARGWTTLRLETGTRQHQAIGLYQRSGYRPIPAFGAYVGSPTSLCYEKRLPGAADRGAAAQSPVKS